MISVSQVFASLLMNAFMLGSDVVLNNLLFGDNESLYGLCVHKRCLLAATQVSFWNTDHDIRNQLFYTETKTPCPISLI